LIRINPSLDQTVIQDNWKVLLSLFDDKPPSKAAGLAQEPNPARRVKCQAEYRA
jgi:hypothetical protein